MTDLPFVSGETWTHVHESTDGPVAFAGDVRIQETTLVLDNILIGPLHTKWLTIGTSSMFQLRRNVLEFARQQGYTNVVLRGVRLKAGKKRRPVHLTEVTRDES